MRKVFRTGQVAALCEVAPRTVSKWFDSGRLRGYRIPGSQDRRIPEEYLEQFLAENGMDDYLKKLRKDRRFLIVDRFLEEVPEDPWTALPDELTDALRTIPGVQVRLFNNPFLAGMEAADGTYGIFIFLLSDGQWQERTASNGQVVT